MRNLAKYSFCVDCLSREEASALEFQVIELVNAWLKRKGAVLPISDSGSFKSKTKANNEGSFEYQRADMDGDQLSELRLDEFTNSEQLFETRILTFKGLDRVEVFVTLSSESIGSAVAPLIANPRCPQIVRDIISISPLWRFHGQDVPREVRRVTGDVEGLTLADHIQSTTRVHPIVVVSDLDGEELLPGLSEKLAFDLQGLAYVCTIDDDASWALTSKLGKLNSCYLGAVRLYWPASAGPEKLYSSVWTASKLLPREESQDQQALEKFAKQVRQRVFGASSEALTDPHAISIFKAKRDKKRDQEISEKGASLAELNDLLASKRDLETKLTEAKLTISRLHAQLQYALHANPQELVAEANNQAITDTPKQGDVRFYKKIHSKSNYDVLVRIADCGHSTWQNAASAHKAKKGIIRLEGSNDWSQVQHCGSCTGGGVWRVKW